MPTLIRLSNCIVVMYAADHLPSHFHVRMHDEREALIGIADLSILSGRIARRELLEALAWAEQNPSRVGQFFFVRIPKQGNKKAH